MQTLSEIKLMILSSPSANSADKIISDNFDFTTFGEKIAFLKGMFGSHLIGEVNSNSDEATYFAILNKLLSLKLLDEKYVRKNLTIPAWLHDIAVENNINFSQVLQTALKEKFGLI